MTLLILVDGTPALMSVAISVSAVVSGFVKRMFLIPGATSSRVTAHFTPGHSSRMVATARWVSFVSTGTIIFPFRFIRAKRAAA